MKNNKQKTEIPKKKTNTIISFLIFFIVVQSFFAYENIIDRLSQKFNTITSCFKNNDQINEKKVEGQEIYETIIWMTKWMKKSRNNNRNVIVKSLTCGIDTFKI